MTEANVVFLKKRQSGRPLKANTRPAEIIIFPGVRFERLNDAPFAVQANTNDKPTLQMRTLFAQLLES